MCSCFLPCAGICTVSQIWELNQLKFFSDSVSSCIGLQAWLDCVAMSPNISIGDEEEIPGAFTSNATCYFSSNTNLNSFMSQF